MKDNLHFFFIEGVQRSIQELRGLAIFLLDTKTFRYAVAALLFVPYMIFVVLATVVISILMLLGVDFDKLLH